LTHPSGLFTETKFWPLVVLAPQIFTHDRDRPRFASTHPKCPTAPKIVFSVRRALLGGLKLGSDPYF